MYFVIQDSRFAEPEEYADERTALKRACELVDDDTQLGLAVVSDDGEQVLVDTSGLDTWLTVMRAYRRYCQ